MPNFFQKMNAWTKSAAMTTKNYRLMTATTNDSENSSDSGIDNNRKVTEIQITTLRNIDLLSIPFGLSAFGFGFKNIFNSIGSKEAAFTQLFYPTADDQQWINSWGSSLKNLVTDDFAKYVGLLEGLETNSLWWTFGIGVTGFVLAWNLLSYAIEFSQVYSELKKLNSGGANFKQTCSTMGIPDISISVFSLIAAIVLKQTIEYVTHKWPGTNEIFTGICGDVSAESSPFTDHDQSVFCTIEKASKVVGELAEEFGSSTLLLLGGALASVLKIGQYLTGADVVTEKMVKVSENSENDPLLNQQQS